MSRMGTKNLSVRRPNVRPKLHKKRHLEKISKLRRLPASFFSHLPPLTPVALRYKRRDFLRVRVQHYLPRLLRGNGHSVRKVSEGRRRVERRTPIRLFCCLFAARVRCVVYIGARGVLFSGSFWKPYFPLTLLLFIPIGAPNVGLLHATIMSVCVDSRTSWASHKRV